MAISVIAIYHNSLQEGDFMLLNLQSLHRQKGITQPILLVLQIGSKKCPTVLRKTIVIMELTNEGSKCMHTQYNPGVSEVTCNLQ